MATPYLESTKAFCARSPFSEEDAAELERKRPGWLATARETFSAWVDSMLAGRGDTPFLDPVPEPVLQWVADLITPRAFDALGRRPSDERAVIIDKREETARAEVVDAADPVNGLRRLPLQKRSLALQANAVVTLATSDQSPYTWRHRQFDAVRRNRRYG